MIALGTIQASRDIDRSEWKRMAREAIRKGIRCFDTAWSYQDAETQLSSLLRESDIEREEFTLIDKVMPVPTLKVKAETSLKRLRTDHIDYLLLHWPSADRSLFAALKALEVLKEEEKALHIGVSNFPLSLLERASLDFEIEAVENPLSLIWTKEIDEILHFCKERGMKFFGYGALGFGILTGRKRGMWCEGSAELAALLSLLQEVSKKHDSTEAQVALSFAGSFDVDFTIAGASTRGQLEELLKPVALTAEEITTLRSLSDKVTGLNTTDNPYCHNWKGGDE